MYFSKIQKKIIEDISSGSIKDLKTFYSAYFGTFQIISTGLEMTGLRRLFDIPKPPIILGINSRGVIFDQEKKNLVTNLIVVWKLLEDNGLVKSFIKDEVSFADRKDFYLPLKESYHAEKEFDFEVWNLIKDYFIEEILVTEALDVFIKKKFKTEQERKDKKRNVFTITSISIAVIGILFSSYFDFRSMINTQGVPDTVKVLLINPINTESNNTRKPSLDTMPGLSK